MPSPSSRTPTPHHEARAAAARARSERAATRPGRRRESEPTPPALALTEADFDAPGRTSFKQRVRVWGQAVVTRLSRLGLPSIALDVDGVAGVVFRAKGGKREAIARMQGATLQLAIARDHVEVALELRAAEGDLEALAAILDDDPRADAVLALFSRVPEQILLDELALPTAELSALRRCVGRAIDQGRDLKIAWQVPREVALLHASLLDELLADAIVALSPIYRLFIGASSIDRDRDRERASRPRLEAKPAPNARPSPLEAARSIGRTIPLPRLSRGVLSSTHGARATLVRTGDPSRVLPSAMRAAEAFVRGTQVRVLGGPFEGKVGVVQALDGKGSARVLFGLLATRVELTELVATDASGAVLRPRRPALGSSHRRPA